MPPHLPVLINSSSSTHNVTTGQDPCKIVAQALANLSALDGLKRTIKNNEPAAAGGTRKIYQAAINQKANTPFNSKI